MFLSSELQRYRVSISKMDFLLSSHGSRESMDSILNNFFVNGCFSSRSSILSLLSPFIIVQICYILPHFDKTRSSIINSRSVLLIFFYSIDFNLLRIFLYLLFVSFLPTSNKSSILKITESPSTQILCFSH